MGHFDNFTGSQEPVNLIAKIHEAVTIESQGIAIRFMSDDNRSTPVEIACRNNALIRQQQHGTGALDFAIHILYAIHERLALRDQQSDELGLVGDTRAKFRKLLAVVKTLLLKFGEIVDARNRDNGEATEMGIHHQGLRIRVADDTNARIALKLIQLIPELGPEIGVVNIMY